MEELLAATSTLVTSPTPKLLDVRGRSQEAESSSDALNIARSKSPTLAALSKPESRLTPIFDARPHSIKARQRLDASEASTADDAFSSDEESSAMQRPQPVKVTLNVDLDEEADEADALPSARLSTLKPSVLHSSAFHSSSRPSSPSRNVREAASPLTPGIAAARALLASPPPRPRSSLLTPTHVLLGGFNNAPTSSQATDENEEQTIDAPPRSRTFDSTRSAPASSFQWARSHTMHDAEHGPRTSVPPAFFTQSFPDLFKAAGEVKDEDRSDLPPREGEAEAANEASAEARALPPTASSSKASIASAEVKALPPRQHSPTTLKAPAFLTRQASTPSAQLSTTASQPIRLHGNARAARAAATATGNMADGDTSWDTSLHSQDLDYGGPSSPRLRLLATDESQECASDSSSLASLAPSGTRRPRSNSSASSHQFSSSADADASGSGRFVRDVSVAGWRQIGAKARGHVVFEVRLNLRGVSPADDVA